MLPVSRAMLYLASASALGLSIRSIWVAPPTLATSVVALSAYSGLFLSGVFLPGLRMFCDVVSSAPNPSANELALTFDDGPDPEFTPKVLDLLDEADAKGTFFVIGRKAAKSGPILRDAVQRGHSVACHSYEHDRFHTLRGAKRIQADLERALKTIEDVTGVATALYRPPVGHTSPAVAHVVEQLDLEVIGWSVRGFDGLPSTRPDRIVERVNRGLKGGAIVLLHDAAERSDFAPTILATLPQILHQMKRRDFRSITVDEMLNPVSSPDLAIGDKLAPPIIDDTSTDQR